MEAKQDQLALYLDGRPRGSPWAVGKSKCIQDETCKLLPRKLQSSNVMRKELAKTGFKAFVHVTHLGQTSPLLELGLGLGLLVKTEGNLQWCYLRP